tara:strand:+ start:528 stop:1313 length:786 start_codon:yes stop_codon:yes gene_type:complete
MEMKNTPTSWKIEDLILRIPNMLSNDECETLINYHKKNEKDYFLERCPDANSGEDTYSSFKCLIIPSFTKEHDIVHMKTREMIKKYLKHLSDFDSFHMPLIAKSLNYSHVNRLLKYETGAKLHAHTDFDHFTHASCTFNLNDEYTGGAFSFWNQKMDVNLKKGEGVIFPSDYYWVHEILPIESGTRYSTNSFIRSIDTDLFNDVLGYAGEELDKRTQDPNHNQYGQYLKRPFTPSPEGAGHLQSHGHGPLVGGTTKSSNLS